MADKMITSFDYGFSLQTTSISTAGAFGASDDGVLVGKCLVPLREMNPDFSPGQEWIRQRKATGEPNWKIGTGYENVAGIKLPVATLPVDFNSYNLEAFLWGLYQTGAAEDDTSPYETTFTVPDSPACEVWFSLLKRYSAAGADSVVIHGCIPRSITISGAEGDTLNGTVEFMGHTYSTAFTGSGAGLVFAEKAPLLWQNATVEVDSNAVNMPDFNLTLTNNAFPQHFDSQTPIKFLLGGGNGFEGSGDFFVPYGDTNEGTHAQMTDYLAGTAHTLEVYWGHDVDGAASWEAGDLACKFYILKTGADDAEHNGEYGKRVSFDIVQSSTNEPITILASNGEDRAIPA